MYNRAFGIFGGPKIGKVIPSTRLIVLVLLSVPVFLAGAMVESFAATGIFYILLLVAWSSLEMLIMPRARRINITRILPKRFSLAVPTKVVIKVENRSRRRITMWVAERLPEQFETLYPGEVVTLAGGEKGSIEYRLIARQRGKFILPGVDVRIRPYMGLFIRQFHQKMPAEVQVFPNLINVKKYDLQLRKGLSVQQGLAQLKWIGQGSEFESLRLYTEGDDLERIDWKATAKRGEPVVRNYQPERQQNILVAIDVGRATAGEFEGISRLDYFINAALMLAYTVLRQGDWFSLIAFSDCIESYLPPLRNVKNIDRVARALYELKPKLVEANYGAACRFLGLKSRRRSFICLMTDVIDRQASDVIIAYMARFARRHLPLIVTLINKEAKNLAEQPLLEVKDPYSKAVAIDVFSARNEALRVMRRYGVGVLDVPPGSLTPELINRYLWVKSTSRL